MKASILIAAAVTAAFASLASVAGDKAALAQAGSNPHKAERAGDGLFNRLDADRDGYVTRDEARDATELQGRFAELDVNNDGKISRKEMQALDAKPGATGSTAAGGSKPARAAPKSGVSK
jgi:hypothetical protein